MRLFLHDVGIKGADRDFPRTVFDEVSLVTVERYAPNSLKTEMVRTLENLFPEGKFNAWGVPPGAASVIRRLQVGDAMLLIRTSSGDGDIPALCIVKAYWQQEMFDLSEAFWGDTHFPYIFFFKTDPIVLTWSQFKQDIGYKPKYDLRGTTSSIEKSKLERLGGAKSYLAQLLKGRNLHADQLLENPTNKPAPTPLIDYVEGKRLASERSYFSRNPQLVADAKSRYGYTCYVCSFNFAGKYGKLGAEYIECHHLNPLSERDDLGEIQTTSIDDVRVVCSNCHRMLHRTRPAMGIEELKAIVASSPYS